MPEGFLASAKSAFRCALTRSDLGWIRSPWGDRIQAGGPHGGPYHSAEPGFFWCCLNVGRRMASRLIEAVTDHCRRRATLPDWL